MQVKDKVIVLTGGGSGIGRELVLELVRRGARVAAIDLNEDALQGTEQLLSGEARSRLSTYVLDITDREMVEALPHQVIHQFGQVDGLINNAGIIQPFVRVNELNYEAIERVMQVNFYGALYMTKAFLPTLMARPAAQVVNVSSMGGFLPVPGQSIYGAAKAGVKLLTESLYAELQGTNVQVTIVFPGAVATNITTNSGVDIPTPAGDSSSGRGMQPLPAATAARTILDGMEKGKARILVGRDARLMDLLYRLSPGFATRFIARQMKALLAE
jgi:short-subunit dehydrogenase